MAERANTAFAAGAIVVPLTALAYALTVAPVRHHMYVHVMAGVLWTGTDLFMGLVLGPVLGSLDVDDRAEVFGRFTPKMTFLMPVLAIVTVFGGVTLAVRLGKFPHADPWTALLSTAIVVPGLLLVAYQFDALTSTRTLVLLGAAVVGHGVWLADVLPAFAMTSPEMVAALVVVTLLSVLGFGVLLPGEVRMYRQMTSTNPNEEIISRIGMRNAKLSGVQGALQLVVVAIMVYIRF